MQLIFNLLVSSFIRPLLCVCSLHTLKQWLAFCLCVNRNDNLPSLFPGSLSVFGILVDAVASYSKAHATHQMSEEKKNKRSTELCPKRINYFDKRD